MPMYQAKPTFSPASALTFGFGELRVGQQEITCRLLRQRPMREPAADGGRVEHMPEVDGKDRHDDQPRRDLLAEQLDADHLAGATIDRRAHQRSFRDGEAVLDRERSEQHARTAPTPRRLECRASRPPRSRVRRALGDCFGGHLEVPIEPGHIGRQGLPSQVNSLEPTDQRL